MLGNWNGPLFRARRALPTSAQDALSAAAVYYSGMKKWWWHHPDEDRNEREEHFFVVTGAYLNEVKRRDHPRDWNGITLTWLCSEGSSDAASRER
jgi:hypothetical protein